MQFNNNITVASNSYDENGEELPTKTSPMKCHILSDIKTADDSDGAKTHKFDMVILTSNSAFAPYSELFNDGTLIFHHNGRKFRLGMASAIIDFGGRTKYYEIGLKQVK